MKNKNRTYAALNAAMLIGLICFAVYLLSDSPTIQKITSENGYTIINQEPFDIKLSIPNDIISEDAYTLDGQKFEPFEITVFEYADSSIYLNKIMMPEDQDDVLQFDFECAYDLEYNGEIILPYWVREDGMIVFSSLLDSKWSSADDPESYTLSLHIADVNGYFSLWVDKKFCVDDNKAIEIPVSATELFYMKGETDMPPNSEPMSVEKIVRILKSYNHPDLEIIDVVRTPESEYGIVGVVSYRYPGPYSERTYNIAFIRKDDSPSEFHCVAEGSCTVQNLEYVGKDTVSYSVEINRNEQKEIINYVLTLVMNKYGEIFFDQIILDK